LVEEVLVEPGVGVEDFEADEAVVLPVEDDEAAGWELGRDGGASGFEVGLGEVDLGRVGVALVGDPHRSPARSRATAPILTSSFDVLRRG
jgi:hypothetical protein